MYEGLCFQASQRRKSYLEYQGKCAEALRSIMVRFVEVLRIPENKALLNGRRPSFDSPKDWDCILKWNSWNKGFCQVSLLDKSGRLIVVMEFLLSPAEETDKVDGNTPLLFSFGENDGSWRRDIVDERSIFDIAGSMARTAVERVAEQSTLVSIGLR